MLKKVLSGASTVCGVVGTQWADVVKGQQSHWWVCGCKVEAGRGSNVGEMEGEGGRFVFFAVVAIYGVLVGLGVVKVLNIRMIMK